MYQQNKSTPKMRKAYTPRVKSAHIINEAQPNKALFFTNQKVDKNKYNINPQKLQQQLSKKLQVDLPSRNIRPAIEIDVVHTDMDIPLQKNNLVSNKHDLINKNDQINKQKKAEIGRNIAWPVSQANHNKKINNQEVIPKRCQSASTTRSVNLNTARTSKIKEQKQKFNQKFNNNTHYIQQRKSMCNQKARPKETIFTIKRPEIYTSYKDFHRKWDNKHHLDVQPQNQKTALFISPSKICGNSTSQEFHEGRDGKKADLAQWSQGFKLQGPIFNATTHQNAFPNHGTYEKMVPIATFNEHPLGMPHKQKSSYNNFFKGEHVPRSNLASWNNLNPISNDFNPAHDTQYAKEHNSKQRQPIQQWPLAQHKLITTGVKYGTQKNTNHIDFNEHELHDENLCRCGRKRH